MSALSARPSASSAPNRSFPSSSASFAVSRSILERTPPCSSAKMYSKLFVVLAFEMGRSNSWTVLETPSKLGEPEASCGFRSSSCCQSSHSEHIVPPHHQLGVCEVSRDCGYVNLWLHHRVFQDGHQMSDIGRKQLLYQMYHFVGLRSLWDIRFQSPPSALCDQLSCVCYKDLSSIATWQ